MVRKVLLSSMCMTVAALMIRAAVAPAQEQRSPAPRQQMVWVDRGGNVLKNIGDSQAIITGPILSPDGNMIAVRGRNIPDGDDDIWIYDLRRNVQFQANRHPSNERQPAWSPNGRSIVYFSYRNGPANLYMVGVESNREQEFLLTPHETYAPTWSSDGKYILYHYHDQTDTLHDNRDLWYVDVEERMPMQFTDTPTFKEAMPRFSPDGNYVAYIADETGKWDAYVKAFPDGRRVKISVDGGVWPRWNGKGDEIYFWQGNDLVVVSVTTTPEFNVSTPKVLFSGEKAGMGPRAVLGFNTLYEVAPDGQTFIVVQNSLMPRLGQ
ncbi:MAG: DPP IV N-terminal domain-containing protein [Gemmatimonadota bacterium]|nr:DPP IV N-terminal domain-containing protein [Gemmatimonadota bacterium]